MHERDASFTGSIPENYDRVLGPSLFAPYAADMAGRVAELGAQRILEIAAGTGIVTRAIAAALPDRSLTATDLNAGMIAVGTAHVPPSGTVRWQQADACALPFPAGAFDAAVAQFGMMFFPDIPLAFREARRVLVPDGTYLFNVWRDLRYNDAPRIISETVTAAFAGNPANFLTRGPHGHDDPERIERMLRDAGFRSVRHELVERRCRAASWEAYVRGTIAGSPLGAEIESRDPNGIERVVRAAVAAGEAAFGPGPLDTAMAAWVFTAHV